jgi:hypothetical protein
MSVLTHHELARTGSEKFGGTPEATRRFVCVVDNPATTTFADCTTAIGVGVGSRHPEYVSAICNSIEITEGFDGNRLQVEVVCEYSTAAPTAADEEAEKKHPAWDANPLLRPDIWSFETQGVAVPALYYYPDDNSNANREPLTNSAYDYFQGLMVDEAQTKAVVKGNRVQFPSVTATLLTNTINSTPWLGAPAHHWKCMGITGELKYEPVSVEIGDDSTEVIVRYWEVTVTHMYRQGGWNLLLPDVGFNYLSGGQKRRVMTFDFENSEWIPSPVPMGLDGNGNQTFDAPAILDRRIYRAVDFNQYFTEPPAVAN